MIIDITDELTGVFHIRYESEVCPNIGDTITLIKAFESDGITFKPFRAVVKSRDHLLRPLVVFPGNVGHNLLTLGVEMVPMR